MLAATTCANIFMPRRGWTRKETRVSLLRRQNVGGRRVRGNGNETVHHRLGITRYIIIYRCCKPRFSVARRRGFSRRHCPSPIFEIIVSDLGSDLPRAAFYGSIKIPDKLLRSRLVFIDYQAARDAREREKERERSGSFDQGTETKVARAHAHTRRWREEKSRLVRGETYGRKIRAVEIMPAPTVYCVTWA